MFIGSPFRRSAAAADRGEPTVVGQSTISADGKGNRLILSLGIVRWLRLIGMKDLRPSRRDSSLEKSKKSSLAEALWHNDAGCPSSVPKVLTGQRNFISSGPVLTGTQRHLSCPMRHVRNEIRFGDEIRKRKALRLTYRLPQAVCRMQLLQCSIIQNA